MHEFFVSESWIHYKYFIIKNHAQNKKKSVAKVQQKPWIKIIIFFCEVGN